MENDLIFTGSSPLVITYNGNVDDVYAPITTTSYDVNMVSKEILDDLYQAGKDTIGIKITEYKPIYDEILKISEKGNITIQNHNSLDSGEEFDFVDFPFQSESATHLFVDINGDVNYHGTITDGVNEKKVNLRYNYSNDTWTYLYDFEGWKFNDFNNDVDTWEYFTDGINSYKLQYADDWSYYYLWDETTNDWNPTRNKYGVYLYSSSVEPGRVNFRVNDMIFFDDGSIEQFSFNSRHIWNPTNKVWDYATPYTLTSGEERFIVTNFKIDSKIKASDGSYIKAVILSINLENWVCSIDKETVTINKLFKIPNHVEDVFTDDYGNFYICKGYTEQQDASIWIWSWKSNSFIEWIKFEDNEHPLLSIKIFTIPSKGQYSKRIYWACNLPYNDRKWLCVSDIIPPETEYVRTFSHYEEENWWGGYVTPNMYSQEISLNLDEISISCIDYLAIMKYITIDKIFADTMTLSYAEILGAIISYVYKKDAKILVDTGISYRGEYDGTNGILDFRCNIANFWDESGEASACYEVIEEMLRPFCCRLYYNQKNEFVLYNINYINTTARRFDSYTIHEDGDMEPDNVHYDLSMRVITDSDIVSNNVNTPTLEIRNTYDKVTGVASTSVPQYSKMIFDIISYQDKDKYSYGDLNVQMNKTKGYKKETRYIRPDRTRRIPITVIEPVTEDKWYYIWNGTYGDPDYELGPGGTGSQMTWFMNCNKAHDYLVPNSVLSNPNGYGSILNFYGGALNPTATGKEQDEEKGVEIKKKITAYAADNGVPPEFLEKEDLLWRYSGAAGNPQGTLTKPDSSDIKWGVPSNMGTSNRIIYHQEYDNIMLSSVQDNVVDIDLSHTFSRTGVDVKMDVMHNNTADNRTWSSGGGTLTGADSYYFPMAWDSDKVNVKYNYFKKYATGGVGSSLTAVWDEMRIDLYVELSDGTYMMFDGLEWVSDTGSHSCPFYLGKLMNNQNLYHTEHRYNLLRQNSTGSFINNPKYALGSEDFVIYYDNNSGVVDKETNHSQTCASIKTSGSIWISESSEGSLKVKLPYIDDPAATVVVNIYNSSMLGMTGLAQSETEAWPETEPFYYEKINSTPSESGSTQNFGEMPTRPRFLPINISHIKAEHLDLSISITVPESNLGQMFSESDIRYSLSSENNYIEQYEMPEFKVNTRNGFVLSSQSYLLFNNEIADPGEFIINGQGGRPESYVVQAYFNWLTRIRRIFNKTVRTAIANGEPELSSSDMNDRRTIIRLPEFPETDYLVVSNSWDVKSDRHTYSAVESNKMEVTYVNNTEAQEIPRMARAERYNLPTAKRRGVSLNS